MFAPCDDEGYVITFAVHEDYTEVIRSKNTILE